MVNPFASRFFRPGAIPFLDSDGCSFEGVLDELRNSGGWGQIVGPHGCGKSTLIHHIGERLEGDGSKVLSFAIRESNKPIGLTRSLKSKLRLLEEELGSLRNVQVIIDGFEQLSWWRRLRMIGICANSGTALLATTHRPLHRLPVLTSIELSAEMAQRVTRQLLDDDQFVDALDFSDLLIRHNGNMREILFDLYDRYQQPAHVVKD